MVDWNQKQDLSPKTNFSPKFESSLKAAWQSSIFWQVTARSINMKMEIFISAYMCVSEFS